VTRPFHIIRRHAPDASARAGQGSACATGLRSVSPQPIHHRRYRQSLALATWSLVLSNARLHLFQMHVRSSAAYLIDGLLRADKELAAIFQFPQGKRDRSAVFHGNQNTLTTTLDLAFVGRPAVEQAVQDAGASSRSARLCADPSVSQQPEPFAAHVLDQNTHLQFTASGNFERVALRCVVDLNRHVDFGFFV